MSLAYSTQIYSCVDGDLSNRMLINVETSSKSGVMGNCFFEVLLEVCNRGDVSVHSMKADRGIEVNPDLFFTWVLDGGQGLVSCS